MDGAIEQFRRVIALQPDRIDAFFNLGSALAASDRFEEAIETYLRALSIAPDQSVIANSLAWLLATAPPDHCRDGAEALRMAEDVCRITGSKNPQFLDTLAAAYAEVGRYDDAVETAQRAIEAAQQSPRFAGLAQRIRERLELYRARRPHRGSP